MNQLTHNGYRHNRPQGSILAIHTLWIAWRMTEDPVTLSTPCQRLVDLLSITIILCLIPQYTSQATHSLRSDAYVATAIVHHFWQIIRISPPELALRWDDRNLEFESTTMSQMGGR
jgi:hypothetical protein